MRVLRSAASIALLLLLLLTALASAQESPWEMRLLPVEDGWTRASPYAINNRGEVVGNYAPAGWDWWQNRPILWRDGGWVDLGHEYGQPDGWLYGTAYDINDAGLAVGWMEEGAGGRDEVAVVWDIDAGTWRNVHPTLDGYSTSYIADVNESGRAIGIVYPDDLDEPFTVYVWDLANHTGWFLPVPAGLFDAEPGGISDSGWVAGTASTRYPGNLEDWENHAVVWDPEGNVVDLHALVVAQIPEVLSTYGSIGPDGRVVGEARTDRVWWNETNQEYLWTWRPGEEVRVLDNGGTRNVLSTTIRARINVGAIGVYGPGTLMPAVWVDGILHKLPTIDGFANHVCLGVNDRGVIVGGAVNPGHWWWNEPSRPFIAELRDDGDYDGDALKDVWELQGYTHDNGEAVDLPSMGANPLRRDLFVEIDAMPGHQPDPETLQPVIDAFAAHDIALHIHIDDDLPFDAELGTLDALKHYQWDEFDALKAAHFDEELESAVRYCVFAHRLATLTDSGLARGEPSSDFIVSLGAFVEESGSTDPWMQAGTFMHELGHTLGLRHGGADVTNRKPNYLSVMNYDFQKQGLRIAGQDGNFDYSVVQLAELNENALVESAGLGVEPLVAGHQTLYRVVTLDPITFETVVETVWSGEVQGAIDWDGSGAIDGGTVSADINADGAKGALTSHHDWANLDFNGGTVGFGVGLPPPPPPPETEVVEELTVEEAKLIPPPPVEGLAGRAGRRSVRISWTPVGPHGQGTYKVYRWSDTTERVLVAETQASLISDRPGRGTWSYVVTVTDAIGAESLDSEELRLRVR